MKIRSVIEFILLFGLVVLIYFRNGLAPSIGFGVAIILGRKAVNRYISEATEKQNKERKKDGQKPNR